MDRWLIVVKVHQCISAQISTSIKAPPRTIHNRDVNSRPAGLSCWVSWSKRRLCVQREQLYRNQSYVCRRVGWIVNVSKNTPTSLPRPPPAEFPFHLQGTAVARNNIMWSKHMLRLIYTHKAAALWTHPGHRILSEIGTLGIEQWGMKRHAERICPHAFCLIECLTQKKKKQPFCPTPPPQGHFCSALSLVVWLLLWYFCVCLLSYALRRIMCHQVT